VAATHNLGKSLVVVQCYESGVAFIPDDITITSSNNVNIDITSYGTITFDAIIIG
jgi:hypothetical protein